jgi:pimeloyl-ACP methyl ester carboxylesterase
MPVVRVGEVELDYERSGSGPPLLLIMGMSGTSLHWGEPFLEALRRDFEVIVYDHRGVGASSRLEGPVTIVEMAADALGLLDALGIETAHIVGISMGGMIAQELALAHPERVRTLTLGCTYCGGPGSVLMPAAVARRLAEARRSGDRERVMRTAWETNVSAALVDDADAYAEYLAIGHRRVVAVPVIMAQTQAIFEHDTSERLAGLTMPVLVIHGTADEVLPVQNGRVVASRIPGSRLEIFEGAGHLFFWEQPARSAALVREHAAVPA